MEEESNGELAFLDTLFKQNNGKTSGLLFRKPADQYSHYSSHHHKSYKESVVSFLFDTARKTRNSNKVDSIETERIVITHLLP